MSIVDAMRALYEQCVNAPPLPRMHYAWCSRCGARGYAPVFGDQAEWHGCGRP